jgi:2-amino-4-hydroxy-6-hydroxymethyldihydropteridine diphosphokinase
VDYSKNKWATTYIGLGSNQNQPLKQLQQACQALNTLPHSRFIAVSPYYQNQALGTQPQTDYINAVACLETTLSPEHLLNQLQTIEHQQGRRRNNHTHWAPRPLDLDILLMGSLQIQTARLTIPHSQIAFRSFVLKPLYTLNPHLEIPQLGPISTLLLHCPDHTLEEIIT